LSVPGSIPASSIVRASSPDPETRIVTSAGAEPPRRNSMRTPSAESVKPRSGETEAFWTTASSALVEAAASPAAIAIRRSGAPYLSGAR
jgi:hypothetical protein